jgi:hypothetical protein
VSPETSFPWALAYYVESLDVFLAFAADSKYYVLNMDNDRLLHFGAQFSWHDFLRRWDLCLYDIQHIPDLDRPCGIHGSAAAFSESAAGDFIGSGKLRSQFIYLFISTRFPDLVPDPDPLNSRYPEEKG